MKSYIVKGAYDTIYDGDIYKVVDEEGHMEYKVDLKQYHIFDANSHVWETWPIDNIHKNIYLSKQKYLGNLEEYPSYETAQKACNKSRR